MMNKFIECPICSKTLQQPVILTCGHTICKKHEIDEKDKDKMAQKVSCPTCKTDNHVPDQGFPSNLLVQNLIAFKFNQLNLGAEHIVAVNSFEDIKRLVSELKRYRENPELEISRVFGELRNKIDLRREKAKKSLDDEALVLITEIDQLEAKCKASILDVSAEIEDLVKLIEKDEIPTWENDLKLFKRKIKRLKAIHTDAITKSEQLRRIKEDMRKKLFGDEFAKLEEKQKKFCLENKEPLL